MADQNITALPAVTTPESSDQLLLVGATEEKLIDYDKLADAILGKIASKNFALDQGNKTLLQALNELNSNLFIGKKMKISVNKSVAITYERYNTISLIAIRKGLYLFSNGYLTTLSKDSEISISISDDYLTLTFANNSAEYLYGMLILTDLIPTISFV